MISSCGPNMSTSLRAFPRQSREYLHQLKNTYNQCNLIKERDYIAGKKGDVHRTTESNHNELLAAFVKYISLQRNYCLKQSLSAHLMRCILNPYHRPQNQNLIYWALISYSVEQYSILYHCFWNYLTPRNRFPKLVIHKLI